MIKGKAGIFLTERTECTEKNNKDLSDLCGLCERKMRVSQMLSKKQSGFTLIEMMVVIGILVIITSIAIPNFMSLLPGIRLNGAARQVMGDLMAARMKAVKLNKRTKVFFDTSSQYRICDDADNNTIVADGEGDVVNRSIQTNYHDVTIDKGSYNDPIFQPRGTASIIILTLTNSQGAKKKVKVHLTGRIMIEDV